MENSISEFDSNFDIRASDFSLIFQFVFPKGCLRHVLRPPKADSCFEFQAGCLELCHWMLVIFSSVSAGILNLSGKKCKMQAPRGPVSATVRRKGLPYFADRRICFRFVAALLACTYFAFRVELFEEEYEQNHPQQSGTPAQPSITLPSLNWETFDKDNAPKAIVVTLAAIFIVLQLARSDRAPRCLLPARVHVVRDKSPPFIPSLPPGISE